MLQLIGICLVVFSALVQQEVGAQGNETGSDKVWWNLTGPELEIFKEGILKEHNDLRKLHQTGPLTLNPALCESAQKEAQRYLSTFKTNGTFLPNAEELEDRNYNDNTLGYHSFARKIWTPKKVVADWVKQGATHNWTDNYFNPYTGHFTQMIWASTEEIGVGMANGRTRKGEYIIVFVVRYSPPGNIMDRDTFAENVLPAAA